MNLGARASCPRGSVRLGARASCPHGLSRVELVGEMSGFLHCCCENCDMPRFRRTSLVDRNSFRSPRGACDSGSVQHRPPGSTSVRPAINPVCTLCRRAKALGSPGRSPPARAMADYFFKDHIPNKQSITRISARFYRRPFDARL